MRRTTADKASADVGSCDIIELTYGWIAFSSINATDKALAGEVQGLAEIILSQGGKSIGGVPTDWWDASGRKQL